MILYYDIYIDDSPLEPVNVRANQEIRTNCAQYRMPKKLDIAKYTLASYAVIPWTHVIIRFDAANKQDLESFLNYAKLIFPNADISQPCSSNQKTYQANVEHIMTFDDDFVFYAPNNDHPLIANNLTHLNIALDKAHKYLTDYQFVSIVYSHLSEFLNAPIAGSPFNLAYASDSQIIENDEMAISFVRFNGDNSSCQIVNKELLHYWFCSHDLGEAKIIRAENVRSFFLTHNQLMIVPKKELCAHFDGYSHTIGGNTEIKPDQVPPLFIPPGFFDNSIRIAFGYPEYRIGWVNINPAANHFCFRDQKKGTDLKIGLQDIPLFWRGRIKEIDINENANFEKIEEGRINYYQIVQNPWRDSTIENSNNKRKIYWFLSKITKKTQTNTLKYLPYKRVLRQGTSFKEITRLTAVGLLHDSNKPLILHFGCGARVLKGLVNIDLNYVSYDDYLQYFGDKYYPEGIRGDESDFFAIDITKTGIPLPDESVDIIFHEDFFEHLNQKEQIIFLTETLRVLKKGGIHRINTPNLLSSMHEKSNFSYGLLGIYLDEWDKHNHLNVTTPKNIEEMAILVGYDEIIFNSRDKSISKLVPLEYRPDPRDRPESGNIFADLIK